MILRLRDEPLKGVILHGASKGVCIVIKIASIACLLRWRGDGVACVDGSRRYFDAISVAFESSRRGRRGNGELVVRLYKAMCSLLAIKREVLILDAKLQVEPLGWTNHADTWPIRVES